MHDWIEELGPGQVALDVGSGTGSFASAEVHCTVIALDEDVDAFVHAAAPGRGHVRVFAQSHALPLAAASIHLVVCHHSLEHIERLDETLREIARVLRPDGRLFVSVPNGYGLCDAVYRWVYEGGGHLNRFRRAELVARVEQATGTRLCEWQKLYSSFVYLWRLAEMLEAPPPGLSKRLLTIGKLPREAITLVQRLLYSGTRIVDRYLGTQFAVYGWALSFDRSGSQAREALAYLNVCPYCGVGQPAAGVEHPAPGQCLCGACSRVYPYFAPFGNTL